MEFFQLNNGMRIPAIGFGCYNAAGGDNYQMFRTALESGYTFFDTASVYETERDLGKAILDSGVEREQLFLQSKLWMDEMGYDQAKRAIERTLNRLQTDYLDVYLIHWPRRNSATTPEEWKSLQRETYRAMEEMLEQGMIKAIGLSNFLPHHLDNILNCCNVAPAVNQIEYHVGYTQEKAKTYSQEKGLVVQAWSPLGRGALTEDETLRRMAERYGMSVSQIALRFVLQSGAIPLPKSASAARQRENLDLFSFELTQDDFHELSCLPNIRWGGEHPDIAIPQVESNFNQ